MVIRINFMYIRKFTISNSIKIVKIYSFITEKHIDIEKDSSFIYNT